jgi:phage terminase large subunit GpA-like protein
VNGDRRHSQIVKDRPVKPPVDVPDNPAILNARADADSRRADLKAAENASTAEDFTTDPKVIAARERYDRRLRRCTARCRPPAAT